MSDKPSTIGALINMHAALVEAAGANHVWTKPSNRGSRWAGGVRMGKDPKKSVVNGYCQTHDVENLFVVGSSVFPSMSGYAPTPTVGALAYRTAEYIKSSDKLLG